LEGDDSDFGWAVEAEGEAHGADAAVDVELHAVEVEVAFGVLLAHGWKDEWTEEGEPDLAAVGVAGEHEIDEMAAGMGDDVVGVVGLVCHEDDRAVGLFGEGEIEVGMALTGVVDAADPEPGAVALDRDVLVDQNGNAMGCEGVDDGRGVEGDVVVAKDGVAEGSGEGGEEFGAAADGVAASDEGQGTVGDEVTGEEDEVGGKVVDFADDALEEERLGVFVEVDVAELNDAVAVEGGGEIVDGDGALDNVELVASDLAGIESHTRGSDARANEEFSSGETRSLGRTSNAGHMP